MVYCLFFFFFFWRHNFFTKISLDVSLTLLTLALFTVFLSHEREN